MLFIRICILNSYVNLNQNQPCQFQISSAKQQMSTVMSISKFNSLVNIPVKFKLLQLCQSNSSLCQIQFVYVIGQVASSHPRTACTFPFGIRRAASSHPRTARASFVPFSQVTSSNTRTACAFYFVSF